MGYYGNQPATGENNSFRVLDDLSSYTLTFDGSSAGVVSTTNSTLTVLNHRFVTGQRVTYNDGGGTAIGGLSDGVYYVTKVSKDTIKLADSYANAVASSNITFSGLGVGSSHTLNIAFDGVNTRFTATYGGGNKSRVTRPAQLQISINGVIQQPVDSTTPSAGFGIDGDSVIVFSTAPSSSDVFWGYVVANNATSFDMADNTVDTFTGDGSTLEFTLSKAVANNQNALVTLDGVVQYPSDATTTRAYTITANIITFASVPALDVDIQVRHIGFAGATSSAVTGFYGRTGNAALQATDDVTVGTLSATSISGTAVTFTTGTFSGNVSIAGTLTYEDVSNIDSVGIITARDTIDAQGNVTVGAGLSVVGVSTLSNVVVGGATTEVVIDGDLRVTGIITTGTGSITFDGNNNQITVGSGVTIYGNTGIISATSGFKGKLLGTPEIGAIDSSISDTAVDVFVYDTRKDSDGGAWRKRTQHTSWYNETLNTSIRGSRREFPAVAVIVAETGKVTIYDGDDPDLPMWMVFETGSTNAPNGNMISAANAGCDNTAISALNGILCVTIGLVQQGGLHTIKFISEENRFYREAGSSFTASLYKGNIAERNDAKGHSGDDDTLAIVYQIVNDVAMTVLPNAPIDSATGLPIPTIAVATVSGVSVIKDDGTVYDVIDTNSARKCYDVSFTKDHKIMHTGDLGAGSTHAGNVFVTNILTADRAEYDNHGDLYRWYSTSSMYPRINGGNTFNTRVLDPIDVGGDHYAMADVGISLIEDGTSSSYGNTDGMVAYATTSYNTGWMHGDIKGAFLSDTDATNVTGSELIPNPGNGNFTATTDWQATSAGGTLSISNSNLKVVCTGNYQGCKVNVSNLPTLVEGKQYIMTVDVAAVSGGSIRFGVVSGSVYNGTIGGNGIFSMVLTAGASITEIFVDNGTSGSMYFELNSVNLRLAELDRSANGGVNYPAKGLGVYGTITKSAVATGAELVAYSGFSNSNYLVQPYNSDMQTGTGAFSATAWFKTTSTEENYEGLLYYNRSGSIGDGWQIMLEPNSADKGLYFYVYGASANVATGAVDGLNDGVWHQVVVTHNNGSIQMFIDGTLRRSNSNPSIGSINDSQAKLHIGRWYGNANASNYYWRGSIALARHSASIPSPEQVKKIYEDEKVLFQENAACTLYGSSDAVTALAYDDSTNLLYAGTSSGRSDFQGLRRINNTTDAVSTAISASNGLVAEQ